MLFSDFTTTTYGKWILAGEHAVVRGHAALVFPVKEKKLTLNYQASSSSLEVSYVVASGVDLQELFVKTLAHGLSLLGYCISKMTGRFDLSNGIPVGSGMGASAALCVALSRWFVAQNFIQASEVLPFAKELEHLFHGKSSGLDVAGVSAEHGIYFKAGVNTSIQQNIQPLFYLSSSNQMGNTLQCVQQVQRLALENPKLAIALDEQMAKAVEECKALLEEGAEEAIAGLASAIHKAADCFYQWGLVSENLEHHMQLLKEAGALAVKPTGSGGGGFVLSLWEKLPPENLGLLKAY